MKKVRVLKDMPFAKVGEIFTTIKTESNGLNFNGHGIYWTEIDEWIKQGWLAWVEEEKSLEEVLRPWVFGFEGMFPSKKDRDIAQERLDVLIPKIKQHYLDAFDAVFAKEQNVRFEHLLVIKRIRKALEEA